jgi:hypothetical protein
MTKFPSKRELEAVLKYVTAFPKTELLTTSQLKHLTASNIKFLTSSQIDLKALWEKRQQTFQSPFLKGRFPKEFRVLERPPSLRGRDFTHELHRLFVVTGDRRFKDAAHALIEHGIVDEKLKFTRWRLPRIAEHEAKINSKMVEGVRSLIKLGKSPRRACAEMAAISGLQANSFEAAIKHLQLLHLATRKKAAAR